MLQRVGDFFKKGSVAGITLAIISAALLITGKGLADRFAIELPVGGDMNGSLSIASIMFSKVQDCATRWI